MTHKPAGFFESPTGFLNLFNDLFNDLTDGAFGDPLAKGFAPPAKATKEYSEFVFPLPGVPKENIQVLAQRSLLTVSTISLDGQDARKVFTVQLDDSYDIDNAVADSKDGLLTVQLPFAKNRDGVIVKFGTLHKEEAPAADEAPAKESPVAEDAASTETAE